MRHIFLKENLTWALLFHGILISHSNFNVIHGGHSNINKPTQLDQGTEDVAVLGQCSSQKLVELSSIPSTHVRRQVHYHFSFDVMKQAT